MHSNDFSCKSFRAYVTGNFVPEQKIVTSCFGISQNGFASKAITLSKTRIYSTVECGCCCPLFSCFDARHTLTFRISFDFPRFVCQNKWVKR